MGTQLPPRKGGTTQFPDFRPMSVVAKRLNGLLLGTKVSLSPGHIVLDGDPASHTKGHSSPTTFWPMSIVAKQLHGSGYHLYGGKLRPGRIVLDGDSAPPHKRGKHPSPLFSPCLLWLNGRPSQQLLRSCWSAHSIVGHIGATGQTRLNLCFVGPTRVHNPNCKSTISSAVFAQVTTECPYTSL